MSANRGGAIVVGSFNQAKAAEIIELLRDLQVVVRRLDEFAQVQPVPEDGVTFAENARLKGIGLARQIMEPGLLGVVADDSGLEVDALDGRPGVYSSRYAGDNATDPDRIRRLLEELDGIAPERRYARFRCHVVLADAERVILEAAGQVSGTISLKPAGTFGFGYDPIFVPEGYDQSFAQLGPGVKHKISHRARALRSFRQALLDSGIVNSK